MKSDVTNIDSRSQRYAEGLNGAIEVLVIEGILIVPNAVVGPRHFIAHEPDTIGSRSGLDLVANRRVCPSVDCRLRPHGWPSSAKCEEGRPTAHSELTIRNVVKHVALPGMSVAPSFLMWRDVLRFGKIRRSRILRRDQVACGYGDPV